MAGELTRTATIGAVLAGACAALLGVGLQRFAYAPLLPALIEANWLTPAEAGLLGAANFAGYLVGAAIAPVLARQAGLVRVLRVGMVLATLCFALCAAGAASGAAFLWLMPWRVLAGVGGGVLMVLAGPAVQLAVAPGARGRAAGVMFAGVGIGVIAGAVIVPATVPLGIPAAWLVLAAAAAGLTALSWWFWPDVAPPPALPMPRLRGASGRLLASYLIAALAATPHMLFWPDFIARGLGRGTGAGAAFWLVWGIGGVCGPASAGWLADRIGARSAYRAILAVQAVAIALPFPIMLWPALATTLLILSSLAAGASAVGLTALVLTCARAIDPIGAPAIWRVGTATYGAAQVATGFILTALLAATGSHLPLFAFASLAAIAAYLSAEPGATHAELHRP